jgi:hypothetical protein
MSIEDDVRIGIAESSDRSKVKAAALQVVQERFSRVHPVWVERHLALLCMLRTEFGADIDKTIILGVIGQRMMQMSDPPVIGYQDILTGPAPEYEGRFTNVESVSAACGIPRETVRRKIAELTAIGWISRGEHGELAVKATAAVHLDKITKLSMDLLASVFEVINHELHMPDANRA